MSEFKKWIGSGINPEIENSVNNNVLNVMRELVEDENSVAYVPESYIKGSKYVHSDDPRVHFLPAECGKPIKITSIQSHSERFNFSVTCAVDALVEFPKEDGNVDLKFKKIFRQYNVIRDGELVMDYISAKLSEESFNKLKSIGILYYNGVKVPVTHNYNSEFVYKIMLKELPLVSSAWAQPMRIGLINLLDRESEISKIINSLKALKKEFPSEVSTPSEESDTYSESYKESKVVYTEPKEITCVIYSTDSPEYDYSIDDARNEFKTLEDLNDKIKSLNKELRYVRYLVRCITFAMENVKEQSSFEWSELTPVPRNRSGKMYQSASVVVEGINRKVTRTIYKKMI